MFFKRIDTKKNKKTKKKNYNKKNKCFLSDRQTDGQTDRRSTQNYSSEPHKIKILLKNNNFIKKIGLTLIETNVICEFFFYFVCICQKCYIISV